MPFLAGAITVLCRARARARQLVRAALPRRILHYSCAPWMRLKVVVMLSAHTHMDMVCLDVPRVGRACDVQQERLMLGRALLANALRR